MHSKNMKTVWFNLSIVILPPDFEAVDALCVRAILSVRKSARPFHQTISLVENYFLSQNNQLTQCCGVF